MEFAFTAGYRRGFLRSGTHVEVQAGSNDIERDKDNSPHLFSIVPGSEGAFLYACLKSYHFVFYFDDV